MAQMKYVSFQCAHLKADIFQTASSIFHNDNSYVSYNDNNN